MTATGSKGFTIAPGGTADPPSSPLDLINDDLSTPADPSNPGKTTDV